MEETVKPQSQELAIERQQCQKEGWTGGGAATANGNAEKPSAGKERPELVSDVFTKFHITACLGKFLSPEGKALHLSGSQVQRRKRKQSGRQLGRIGSSVSNT